MNISFEAVLDVATIISIVVSGIMTWKTSSKQHEHEQEMLKMKQEFEIYIRDSQEAKSNRDDYELQRRTAIKNYCNGVGSVLADTYDTKAFAKFEQSVGEIFMYTPADKHPQITELNDLLHQIQQIHVRYDDDGYSYQKRSTFENKARNLYQQLCQDFSDLGAKNPLVVEDQQ